jgi:hypothetical protein
MVRQARQHALTKFSDMLTLAQPEGADYAHPLALPCLKNSVIMPLPLYPHPKYLSGIGV